MWGIWKWPNYGVLESINWENQYKRKKGEREGEVQGNRDTTWEMMQGMDFSSPTPTAHQCLVPFCITFGHNPRKRRCWGSLQGSSEYPFDDQQKEVTALSIWKSCAWNVNRKDNLIFLQPLPKTVILNYSYLCIQKCWNHLKFCTLATVIVKSTVTKWN